MPARSNACSELTRFWLRSRHGYLIDESIPVRVHYALSDIDLVAMHPQDKCIPLPDGSVGGPRLIGPRLIVETKDEHDWEPSGREFGAMLRGDVAKMAEHRYVPRGVKGVKFTMLREEHYQVATSLFGSEDFDRLFVLHALDPRVRAELAPSLALKRIYLLNIRELLEDILQWYGSYPRPSGLRNTLIGDLLHLLVGFCKMQLPPTSASAPHPQ